jgi:hypothetical protein
VHTDSTFYIKYFPEDGVYQTETCIHIRMLMAVYIAVDLLQVFAYTKSFLLFSSACSRLWLLCKYSRMRRATLFKRAFCAEAVAS